MEEPPSDIMPAASRPKSEHAMILAGIEDALTQAGIWGLRIEKTSAAKYTRKRGDSLVLILDMWSAPRFDSFKLFL
jgi:hypothetical protein